MPMGDFAEIQIQYSFGSASSIGVSLGDSIGIQELKTLNLKDVA
jgi:hypothetical protein